MENQYLYIDAEDRLIFEPKPWTNATRKMFDVGEDQDRERRQLEAKLPSLQNTWQKRALENLQNDKDLWQITVSDKKKVGRYIFNAVREATHEALSGILNGYAPEETEESIGWALMTPNDNRPFRFVRMEEETESIYSFQNLEQIRG